MLSSVMVLIQKQLGPNYSVNFELFWLDVYEGQGEIANFGA